MKLDTTYGSVTFISESNEEDELLTELAERLTESDVERDIYEDGAVTLQCLEDYSSRHRGNQAVDGDRVCLTVTR